MAAKAKESSSVGGKEKKAPSSSLSTITKKPTKPSSNPEKQAPSYLRSTKTSRSESQSLKLPKTDAGAAANKPIMNRRRSFDKPVSSCGVQKQKQPSPSRQHKALVSPGPRERRTIVKSAVGPVKSIIRSQSISEKTPSKTGKDGKTQPVLVATKWLKKSVSSCTSSSSSSAATKKVMKDDAKSATSPVAEGTDKLSSNVVEAEPEVKEAIHDEVVKLESHEDGVGENVVSEVEHGHGHDHDHDENEVKTEEADQGDEEDEKVVPTVSEEQEQEQEEKIIEDHEKNKAEQEESNSNTKNESATEVEEEEKKEVEVKEKEEETEQQGEDVAETEQKSSEVKGNNKKEEEEVKKEIEGVNEEVVKSEEAEKVKEEVGKGKQQSEVVVVMMHGKKAAQVSNGVIEETASKLLQEERRNKVRALAGAFQSVIDFQTK